VGDNRAHTQFVGKGHGLSIGGFSLFSIWRVTM